MEKQCQRLSPNERKRHLHILRKSESLFDETLGTRKPAPVDLELKDDATSMCPLLYQVPRLHKAMFKI